MIDDAPAFEFSHPIALEEIVQGGIRRHLEADEGERGALAERFDLLGIGSLVADLTVKRLADGPVIGVSGTLTAVVHQECVVTLDVLETHVEQTIDERFVPAGEESPEISLSPDDENFDEPLEGEMIDLGEVVAQCFGLALDPYPRKEGAAFEAGSDEAVPETKPSPFAALIDFKPRKP